MTQFDIMMDSHGRLVLPIAVRRQIGLLAGARFIMDCKIDGKTLHITLTPAKLVGIQ